MMDRLREGVNSIAVKIILGVIILSFIFAGVGSYVASGNNAAAKVGSVEISLGEFEMAYQNERNRMQSELGDSFSQLLANPAYVESLRKSVLDRMINDVLLRQQAEALGLRVSDAQIRQTILEMPQFQMAGQFNQDIYQSALRRAGFSPDTFAEYMRGELVRDQLIQALQSSGFMLDGEVEAQGGLVGQTRDIRTVTLDLATFAKNVEITDEELQTYYEENPENFTRPEQYKVSYVELSAAALKAQVELTDDEVRQYYDENLDKYSSEEQRRVAHILIEGDDEAKAQAILDELNGGADFATLASEKSDDLGSAENGGDLGWIERDVMDAAFEEAAFALTNVGETSGLVQSDFGFHIIKLEELNDSVVQPFDEVSEEIKQELVDTRAVDQFYDLQSTLEKIAFEFPDSLDDAAQAVNQEIKTTDFVSAVDAPAILTSTAVMQAITSPEVKEDGLNSEAIEVAPEHIIVVRVEDVRDETVLPLEEVKAQAEMELANVKGEQKALELGTQLVDELKAGNTAILEENELAFSEESETISRRSPLASMVFAMAKPGSEAVYGQTKDAEGNIVVVELSAYNQQLREEDKVPFTEQLSQVNSQQDISAIVTELRNSADIEYYVVSN